MAQTRPPSMSCLENHLFKQLYQDRSLRGVLDLYKLIADAIIQIDPSIEISNPIYKDFRPGDVRHSQASINKAKELLNYEPQFRIAEGLNEAIGWYINSLK